MIRIYIIGMMAGLLMLAGCKKDKVDLTSPVPSIELISVTPGTVTELEDSLVFTIAYRDGDGDLGENTPDVVNLFIVDNRIGLEEGFRIPQLAPDGAEIAIAGTLNVVLPGTGITDNSTSQTATFNVYLRDRAGNPSNTEVSEEITIVQ